MQASRTASRLAVAIGIARAVSSKINNYLENERTETRVEPLCVTYPIRNNLPNIPVELSFSFLPRHGYVFPPGLAGRGGIPSFDSAGN